VNKNFNKKHHSQVAGLTRVLLKLYKTINENTISTTLRNLDQNVTRKLQYFLLSENALWLKESGLINIGETWI